MLPGSVGTAQVQFYFVVDITHSIFISVHCFILSACFCCEVTAWDAELIHWSPKRASSELPEKQLVLCGACLKHYKHMAEYCIVCFKLYSDSKSLEPRSDNRAPLSEGDVEQSLA